MVAPMICCFNGAGLSLAWIGPASMASWRIIASLQWSRAFTSLDSDARRNARFKTRMLQWSRAFTSLDSLSSGVFAPRYIQLASMEPGFH